MFAIRCFLGNSLLGMGPAVSLSCDRCTEKKQMTTVIPHFALRRPSARILIDPFLSDNPSWDKGWSGYLTGENSTQGGDR
jgi:hypothetical protein